MVARIFGQNKFFRIDCSIICTARVVPANYCIVLWHIIQPKRDKCCSRNIVGRVDICVYFGDIFFSLFACIKWLANNKLACVIFVLCKVDTVIGHGMLGRGR